MKAFAAKEGFTVDFERAFVSSHGSIGTRGHMHAFDFFQSPVVEDGE